MAAESEDLNNTEEYTNDEDARSDVTYFDLDEVEEVSEAEFTAQNKNESLDKTDDANDDDDAISDITIFSEDCPDLNGIEPNEKHCRLCLTECNENAANMADFTDVCKFYFDPILTEASNKYY